MDESSNHQQNRWKYSTGMAVLQDPASNKGTAFTEAERAPHANVGNKIAARMPMIAMITSNSIRVNPRDFDIVMV